MRTFLLKSIIVYFALLLCLSKAYASTQDNNSINCITNDSLELINLYQLTDGANWITPWDTTSYIANWHGITLSTDGCSVIKINLSDNGLTGTVPNLLIPTLVELDLSANDLSGHIPNFEQLGSLSTLNLSINSLSDSIPNFEQLPNLSILDLSYNQLSSTIPSFEQLTSLYKLDLSANDLSGTIPNFIQSSLGFIFLSENNLEGAIPIFDQLNHLTRLDLSNNGTLSGSIPSFEYSPFLLSLNLSGNSLTGSIPNFETTSNLGILDLSRNNLTGSIPNFENLINLSYLYLYENNLSSTIPTFDQLVNLNVLDLSANNLEGAISDFAQLTSLYTLDLSENNLDGTIPNFTNLSDIGYLDLSENFLVGSLPELSHITYLGYLNLSNNLLEGCFPEYLCALEFLYYTNFNNNPALPDSGSDSAFDNFCLNDLYQYGLPCDDGDPTTIGEVILKNCNCAEPSFSISGNVAIDENDNCVNDVDEYTLKRWIVQFIGTDSYYAHTDSLGNYSVGVDTGSYVVNVIPPNIYWSSCIIDTLVSHQNNNDSTVINFPISRDILCPLVQVEIGTPLLRNCTSNIYTVNYCNQGTIAEENTLIEISLDTTLIVDSTTIQWSSANNNLGVNNYTFDIGHLGINECSNFQLFTTLSCESETGEQHCVEAHVNPDTTCLSNGLLWDGSDIRLEATCIGDSIHFIIRNVGAPMSDSLTAIIVDEEQMLQYSHLIIVEDELMFRFKLDQDEEKIKAILAEENKTYRLAITEIPGHPLYSQPAVSIQGCPDEAGIPHIQIVNNYSPSDSNPFEDSDCQTSVSNDSFNLVGNELRVGSSSNINSIKPIAITEETRINFHLPFLNTGKTNANSLIIVDTLSSYLDISTFKSGLSSHEYTWNIEANNILTITFENIALPSHTIDETNSMGFVQFSMLPKRNLLPGTLIKNKGAVYCNDQLPRAIDNQSYQIFAPYWQDYTKTINICEGEYIGDEAFFENQLIAKDTSYFQYFTIIEWQQIKIHQAQTTYIDSLATEYGDAYLQLQSTYGCDSTLFIYYLIDADGDGFSEEEDCNDADANIHPNAVEIVNSGQDENCDGISSWSSIKVSPNPFEEILTISSDSDKIINYELYNTLGHVLFSDNISVENNKVNIAFYDLNAGLYFLKIKTANEEILLYKLIKL